MKPLKIDTTAPYLCFDFSCSDEIGLQVTYQRTERSDVEVYDFGDTDTQGTQIYRRSGKFGEPHKYMRVPLDGSDAVENIILGTSASRYVTISSVVDGEAMEGLPEDAVERIHRLVLENNKLRLAQ
jgi:hypothetical protein